MTYVTISDNAEVGLTSDKNTDDALLVLTAEQAKDLLVQLTQRMKEADII